MNVMAEVMVPWIQEQEKKGKDLKDARWSTRFHIMPLVGWLNDPNGLCYYNGDYHFFFQYAPFDAKGGLKFWGHMKSKDMLHWTYEGVPLFPDSPYDCGWQGSECDLYGKSGWHSFYRKKMPAHIGGLSGGLYQTCAGSESVSGKRQILYAAWRKKEKRCGRGASL